MSYLVKRVPLDFSWPFGVEWEGYINPHEGKSNCSSCMGTGFNADTYRIYKDFYDLNESGANVRYEPIKETVFEKIKEIRTSQGREINWDALRYGWQYNLTQDEVDALVESKAFPELTHTWSEENGWERRPDHYMPTAEEVAIWNGTSLGLCEYSGSIAAKVRAKRLGVYGECMYCSGKGEIDYRSPEEAAAYNSWEPLEPPEGPGWQLWEDVSLGSVVTPVFETPEQLADHCAANIECCRMFLTSKEWLKMFIDGTTDVGTMMTGTLQPVCRTQNWKANDEND